MKYSEINDNDNDNDKSNDNRNDISNCKTKKALFNTEYQAVKIFYLEGHAKLFNQHLLLKPSFLFLNGNKAALN